MSYDKLSGLHTVRAGNICMFRSNTNTHISVASSLDTFNSTLLSLYSYVTTVPKQINHVVNQSTTIVDTVKSHVSEIGNLLGKGIQNTTETQIYPTLVSLSGMAEEVSQVNLLLQNISSVQFGLQKNLFILQSNLTTVIKRINTTLSGTDCFNCAPLQSELNSLVPDINLNFPSLIKFNSIANQLQKSDLNSQRKRVEDFLESIPELVTNKTKDAVEEVNQKLQSIKDQILQTARIVPVNTLTLYSRKLYDLRNYARRYTSDIKLAEKIRWIIALIICCVVLLVVVCNLLALLFGPLGVKPNGEPSDKCNTANSAGMLLLVNVGFSFVFSWIFMVAVTLVFLVGGNAYTLICSPWQKQQLFELIDTPGVFPQFQISQSLGLKSNLTIGEMYNDCQMNKSLWYTLHLHEVLNLDDYLNVSKYIDGMQKKFESNSITLTSLTILDKTIQTQLSSYSLHANNVDYKGITAKINTIVNLNLDSFAYKLDRLADAQTNNTIKTELRGEAIALKEIQTWSNNNVRPMALQLNSLVMNLSVMTSQTKGIVDNLLVAVIDSQSFLINNSTEIVKSKLTDFVNCQINTFKIFTKWVYKTITEQVGCCGSVAAAMNSVENLFCSQLVESLNDFWYSLGWCIIFFIPSIIFSMKLSKLYRQIHHKDTLADTIVADSFPQVIMRQNSFFL